MTDTAAKLADDANTAIQQLNNHASHPADRYPGLEYPGDVYATVGSLKEMAGHLPQALEQLRRFIDDTANDGHLGIDASGTDVAGTQCDLEAATLDATAAANALYDALNRAHCVLSHVNYKD